jgi:Zn-finger nucleic acid-binding protein
MENQMRCPVDNEVLVMADRGGVEIDYCPKCRGVWLDRGELDKIIERSLGGATAAPAPAPMAPPPPQQGAPVYQPEPRAAQGYREDDRRRYKDDDNDYRYKKKRKDSFLSDIFDF